MTSDSIIGVDRTFNLGPCFLTCMVYQNHNLIRKHTKSSPIMLGPMFLHWDGLYSTYCDFFCKIRSALGFHIPEEKIVFGSDEEQAMINAIKTAFPKAQHILCTRHLKENAQRNLSAQNVPEKSRSRVISAIFGSTGLIYSYSRVEIHEYYKTNSSIRRLHTGVN